MSIVFSMEEEYHFFYKGRVSSCFSNKPIYTLRAIFFMLPTSFPIIRTISRISSYPYTELQLIGVSFNGINVAIV